MTTEREREEARQHQRAAEQHQPPRAEAPRAPPARDPKGQTEPPPPSGSGFTEDQIATPPSGVLAGGKQIQAVFGPHAGLLMIIPEAEADQAIADKWAVEVRSPPVDHTATQDTTPLDDAQRQAATDAANAWTQSQLTQPPADEEGRGRSGNYETRGERNK